MTAEFFLLDLSDSRVNIRIKKLCPEHRENCLLARTVETLVYQQGLKKIVISRRNELRENL